MDQRTPVEIVRRETWLTLRRAGVCLVAVVGLRLVWGWYEGRKLAAAVGELVAMGVNLEGMYVPPKGATREVPELLDRVMVAAAGGEREAAVGLNVLDRLATLPPADWSAEWDAITAGRSAGGDEQAGAEALAEGLRRSSESAVAAKDWESFVRVQLWRQGIVRGVDGAPRTARFVALSHLAVSEAEEAMRCAPMLAESREMQPAVRAWAEGFVLRAMGDPPGSVQLRGDVYRRGLGVKGVMVPVRGWVTMPLETFMEADSAGLLAGWHPTGGAARVPNDASQYRIVRAQAYIQNMPERLMDQGYGDRRTMVTAAICVAVNLYRVDTGHWPGTLAELVPKYLAVVPLPTVESRRPFELMMLQGGKRAMIRTVGTGWPTPGRMADARGMYAKDVSRMAYWTDVSPWEQAAGK